MTVEELEKLIIYHNNRYFQDNDPEITDEAFDKLVLKLRRLDPNSKVLVTISDSLKINNFDKVSRDNPMLSLQKCYNEEDLLAWANGFSCQFVATAKVDGCAVELVYDELGELVLAATRGDGYVGENITVNSRTVRGIPHKIKRGLLEIRGEVYMPLSVFSRYKDDFANPRNLAAGGLRQKNSKDCEEYDLAFLAYDVIGLPEIKKESEKIALLEEMGFQLPKYLTILGHERLQRAYEEFYESKNDLDYDTDGVVFKVDEIELQEEVGRTSHHPKYAMAYKYQGESAVTKIKGISWQVARSGKITPVGIIEPTKLSGAIVSKVTLHNWKKFFELDLREGASVRIRRSGGVIPYFEEVVEVGTGEQFLAPLFCPACKNASHVRGDFLFCLNPEDCVGSQINKILHFASCVGMGGIGPALTERLYNAGLVRTPKDLYKLTTSDLLSLDGVGETLAEVLLVAVKACCNLKLETLLCALGISGLSTQTAKILTKKYKNLEELMQASEEQLQQTDGIGYVTAKNIHEGLRNSEKEIEDLSNYITIICHKQEFINLNEKIVNKQFLFTGKLVSMTRDRAEKLVENQGGCISASVNRDLDYLVVGQEGSAGGKLEKAKKLQEKGGKVQIITEAVWMNLINSEALFAIDE